MFVFQSEFFRKLDENNNGEIEGDEFKSMMKSLYGSEFDDDQLAAALQEIDSDSSGTVSFNEFIKWYVGSNLYTKYKPQ